jgi:putative endonuclease
MWYVYILKCSDRTLYTGVSTDPVRRLAEHNAARGAKALRGRLPARLVWRERKRTRGAALAREAEIKRWPRVRKLALVGSAAAVACLLVLGGTARAEILGTEGEVRAALEAFMGSVVERKVEPAFRAVRRYVEADDAAFDLTVFRAVRDVERMETRLGRPYRYEAVSEEKAGTAAVRYAYAVAYASDVVRWEFTVYRKPDKPQWVIQKIDWLEGTAALFEDERLIGRLRGW